jgi:hypothetical protein
MITRFTSGDSARQMLVHGSSVYHSLGGFTLQRFDRGVTGDEIITRSFTLDELSAEMTAYVAVAQASITLVERIHNDLGWSGLRLDAPFPPL